MSETANAVALRVIRAALVKAGAGQGRVFLHRAGPSVDKPYIIMTVAGSNPANMSPSRDFVISLNILAVATSYAEAVSEADKVRVAINDKGFNDITPELTDSIWSILAVSEDTQLTLTDNFEDATPAFMEGATYVITMEVTD